METKSNLVELPPPEKRRSEDAIDTIKNMLAKAEAGEIETVLAVLFAPDGNGWIVHSESIELTKKLGMLERLKFDIMKDWL